MNIVERVPAILLRPKETWPRIAAEPATPASIYGGYLVFLAAIPAICGFIGWTLVGGGMMGISYRMSLGAGLVQLVVGYLLSLGLVWVLALIVNALAPTFGGSKDFVAALKVVAYGSTAGFVGGVFSLLPALGWLGLLAAIYSIYLIYTGLPVLMHNPAAKSGAYTAVVVVCSFVAMIVLGAVSALFVEHPLGGATRTVGGAGSVQIKTPDGATVTINPQAMADMAKRMEEATKQVEQAQKSGDGASAGLGAVLGAVAGSRNVEPVAPDELKAMLPETIGDLKRTALSANAGKAMGFSGSGAQASYAAGDRHVDLAIVDTAGLAGIANLVTGADMTMDKESDGNVEKMYKQGARTVQEKYRKDGSRSEMSVILANGMVVAGDGNVDIATLKRMVESVDLGRLEATKHTAKR
ncbi:MAG TPA: Yip1 family protein [Caldimonas sp.]|nr:Yip1 family protein [Caldimonas sp.]